jgi:phosphomethylpyrimidine synthase
MSRERRKRGAALCGPHFCSMKITQEVRAYAAEKGIEDVSSAIEAGLNDKANQFKQQGSEVYKKI